MRSLLAVYLICCKTQTDTTCILVKMYTFHINLSKTNFTVQIITLETHQMGNAGNNNFNNYFT